METIVSITPYLEGLNSLCSRHHVKALYLFGSALRSDFDADRSDIDLLVEFLPMRPEERARRFFDLERSLRALLGAKVDLGEFDGIRNPRIREAIERTRVPVYAAA